MNVEKPSSQNRKAHGFHISPSVSETVTGRPQDDHSSPVVLAARVLEKHPEYGRNQGRAKYEAINHFGDEKHQLGAEKPPGFTPMGWLETVCTLYDPRSVTELHGRLFLLGLAMLDPMTAILLLGQNFLKDLAGELKEPIDTLLSDRGKSAYAALMQTGNEYLENQADGPVTGAGEDLLGRAAFARFLVQLLNNSEPGHGALAIHLHAPWGAGKTSFMNFMQEALRGTREKKGRKAWQIVDFNAWQNQRLSYPWWTLMNSLYDQVKGSLTAAFRVRVWYWRLRSRYIRQLIALLACCLVMLLFSNQTAGFPKWVESTSKIVAAMTAIWGIALSFSKGLFSGNQKAAQEYLDSRDNPMSDYQAQFKRLVEALSPSRLIVFIDDLDRCKSAYTVDFLENLQTLFRDDHVVFLIAADLGWLHGCYEVEYDKIKTFVQVPGKTIGPLFTEKMFQLSVSLPGASGTVKDSCWDSLLGIPPKKDGSAQEKGAGAGESTTGETEQQQRVEALEQLSQKSTVARTEHFLRPYNRYLDLNPRNMKRLLNQYLVNKAASVLTGILIPRHQLALWTIIQIQWPLLANYFARHPDALDTLKGPDPGQLPTEISSLLQIRGVRDVLDGEGISGPLLKDTVLSSGLLFSCIAYPAPGV